MDPVTLAFLVVGGVGVGVLAVSLLVGDLLGIGHPDAGGPFSLPAVAGFVGAFGFAGAIADVLVPGDTTGLVAGLLAGLFAAVPTAWLTVRLSRWAMAMRTDPTPTTADLLGRRGVVLTPIPTDGYGEVRVTLAGQPVKLYARADRPLPRGAHVFVVAAPSPTSVFVEETPAIEEV
jgi:membrane protein implicated in regulation of membrane protease activity